MKVLVTGGLGFIGCNLLETLNSHGDRYEVTIFDNESLGKRSHIAGLKAEVVLGDLTDKDAVYKAIEEADAVVHLAADTRVLDSIGNPSFNFDVNVIGSMNILEAMRKLGKKRVVCASTGGAILGEVPPPINEDIVPKPISPYGASKLAMEGYLSAYGGSYGMLPAALRFANVYGPRSFHKGSVVAAFFKNYLNGERLKVYGDGEQTRDFIYVKDLSDVIVRCLESEITGVYQLGFGKPVTVNELIDEMSKVVGEDLRKRTDYLPARAGEIENTYCDITHARTNLGFEPKMPLSAGLPDTWEWFKAHTKK